MLLGKHDQMGELLSGGDAEASGRAKKMGSRQTHRGYSSQG